MVSTRQWQPPQLDSCRCGKQHDANVDMPDVWFDHGILGRIATVVDRYIDGSICLVADDNTKPIAEQVKAALGDRVEAEFIHPGQLPAKEAVVQALEAAAGKTRGFVSVGSGCITDVTRLAAFHLDRPLVAVATVASMDGYLSGHSPIIIGGYKLTCPARPPKAVVADPEVLVAAPRRLTCAGLGDVLGKYSALADWRLAHVMTDEYWCPSLSDSVHRAVINCQDLALKTGKTAVPPAEAIMEGLLVTGHAMVCVGNSRPASGGEHHISHYWEMRALARGEEAHLHGEQVAVALVLLAAVYQEMLGQEDLVASASEWQKRLTELGDEKERSKRLREGFGPAAESVGAETRGKDIRLLGQISYQELQKRWTESRRVLAGAIPEPGELVALLRVQGMAATPRDLGISEADTKKALLYARELRNRFGILDVAAAAGRLQELAEAVAHSAASW